MAARSTVRGLATRAYPRWVVNPAKALRPVRVASRTRPRSARAMPTSSAVIRPETITYPSSVSRRATSRPVAVAPGMVVIITTSLSHPDRRVRAASRARSAPARCSPVQDAQPLRVVKRGDLQPGRHVAGRGVHQEVAALQPLGRDAVVAGHLSQ